MIYTPAVCIEVIKWDSFTRCYKSVCNLHEIRTDEQRIEECEAGVKSTRCACVRSNKVKESSLVHRTVCMQIVMQRAKTIANTENESSDTTN